MRGLFNKIFFNAASRLLKDVSLKCFTRNFQYIKLSDNICKFSSHTQYLFIDVINRFINRFINKVANIEVKTEFMSLL